MSDRIKPWSAEKQKDLCTVFLEIIVFFFFFWSIAW
jgi:hypothetical protein